MVVIPRLCQLDRVGDTSSLPTSGAGSWSEGQTIDDDSALKAEARTQAVHLAQLQAEQMAKAAGVKLGRIRLISEVPASGPMPYYEQYAGDAAKRAVGSAAPAPVLPGQQELSLTVDVVWEIAQ